MSEPSPSPVAFPRPAELVDRFLARLIDGVILGLAFAVSNVIFGGLFLGGLNDSFVARLIFAVFFWIAFVAASLGYYAYMESTKGATLGKLLLKLEVVSAQGTRLRTEESIRRNLFLAIPLVYAVPVLGAFLGGLASLAAVVFIAFTINDDTVNRQGWHDQFAGGTRVLKTG